MTVTREGQIALPTTGMTCASCVSHVEAGLRELPSVRDVVVNLATHKATDGVGYGVAASELTLEIRGMTCASCVSHVEEAVLGAEGVLSASVNLESGTARVTYVPGGGHGARDDQGGGRCRL